MGIVKTAVSKFRTTLLVMIFLIIMGMFGRAACLLPLTLIFNFHL